MQSRQFFSGSLNNLVGSADSVPGGVPTEVTSSASLQAGLNFT